MDDRQRVLLIWRHRFITDSWGWEEELAARYELDRVVRSPRIETCTAVHLDGPLAGTVTHYAINELGSRAGFALPPEKGRAEQGL
ncbi:hypothetical protein HNR21_000828 [Actinomadura cellulosilytica]|uniref:Uncharacterized protein n=1 Tax=Thermomonospora cellulosilytica TaxID=1411118 RepID=A0A7W3MU56_9ACTN|nr:hypothetical protein [Thermomonospora cellulosilytica]